jgi:hypothetical protein
MSIFEKLGFKKKSEDIPPPLDEGPGPAGMPPLREEPSPDLGPPMSEPSPMPRPPSFEPPSAVPAAAPGDSRSIDLVNAKLDAIKAVLDNINVRIERLEKIAAGEEETPRWR